MLLKHVILALDQTNAPISKRGAAEVWFKPPRFWLRDRIYPISTFVPQNPIPGAHGAADARGPDRPRAAWSPGQRARGFCSLLGNGAKS